MICANCGTTQGPFTRKTMPGYSLCKINELENCTKRRRKLDVGKGRKNESE